MVAILGAVTIAKEPAAFFSIYAVAIGYLTLWVALVMDGAIRQFNRIGDYSYGIYLYAYPMQQLAAASVDDATP